MFDTDHYDVLPPIARPEPRSAVKYRNRPSEPTRILVVDNYDSFVYNLVQYVGEVADQVLVRRNDAIDVADVRAIDPTGVVVSPGPGTPAEAGVSIPLFAETDLPILGVCLGHQALCAAAGAPVVHAPEVVHGKPSIVSHDGEGVFAGLPDRFRIGRYHSLAVERDDLPAELVETAITDDEREVLMAVRHREKPHVGVQFHPESILTRELDNNKGDVEGCDGRNTGSRDARDARDAFDGTHPTDGDNGDGAAVGANATGERISLQLGKTMVRNFCELAAASAAAGR